MFTDIMKRLLKKKIHPSTKLSCVAMFTLHTLFDHFSSLSAAVFRYKILILPTCPLETPKVFLPLQLIHNNYVVHTLQKAIHLYLHKGFIHQTAVIENPSFDFHSTLIPLSGFIVKREDMMDVKVATMVIS